MLASAIALHSVQLATNTNGALLLTWFLDTCTFPHRRTVLAPRLVPHLVHLCTHKVAYLTVLKVINQRNESSARELVLRALFFSADDTTLEQVLSDQSSGATLIFKVLTTPFFDETLRAEVVKNVSKVLIKMKAQPNQGYKRLMDELGMSARSGPPQMQNHAHPTNHERQRQMPQQTNHGFKPTPALERHVGSGQYVPAGSPATFVAGQGLPRSGSADSINFGAYNFSMNGPTQSPYQTQALLHQLAPPQLQYPGLFPPSQRSNNNFVQAGPPSGFLGYATTPPSVESINYRNISPGLTSPLSGAAQMEGAMMNAGPGFEQQGISAVLGGNMYSYPQPGYPSTQQMHSVHSGGGNRRGRVGTARNVYH